MKLNDLTEKEIREIKELAHKYFLDKKIDKSELFITQCIALATIDFLLKKGYNIEKK